MDDARPLASLSLTHVYYDPSDPVSYLCAWLALVPQALCVVYVTLIWSTREAEVALMFTGQLACEGVNLALKRLIKEQRPARIRLIKGGYGMPSSHSQFAFFWALGLTLFLLARHRPSAPTTTAASSSNCSSLQTKQPPRNDTSNTTNFLFPFTALRRRIEARAHKPWSLPDRLLVSLVALLLAAAVAWSRIYLGYHTPRQALVGCAAGALSAVVWFAATCLARQTGLLAWCLEMPVARWLRVRDLAVEEDLCQAGWEKWEGRRAARMAMKMR